MLGNRSSFGLSDEQEAGFHQHNLQTDIKQASIGVLLVILPLILFVSRIMSSMGLRPNSFGSLFSGWVWCSTASCRPPS